mmetsp:Transcript_72284/g.169395  ORF Transcript_72284/g.169395 Transcript_72284/m.169395 type:complete len:331 (+) Transcript_72284:580-1572(+)
MLVQVRNLAGIDGLSHLVLREKREDRDASMAADHGHADVVGILPRDLANELVGPHHVQGRDAHDLQRIQAFLLVQLGHSRHDRVHRVDDHSQHGIRTILCASFHNAFGNVRVHLEEVIAGHPRLPGHASRDEDQVAALEALLEVVDRLRADLHDIAFHIALPLQVAQVRCDARRWHHGNADVEDAQLLDIGVEGHKHRKRLSNSTGAATDAHLEVASRFCLRSILGLGLGLHLRLGFGLWCWRLRLLLGLHLGLRLRLGLWCWGRGRLRLLLTLLDFALLPVGGDDLLLVLPGIVFRELLPRVRDSVLRVDSALGHRGQQLYEELQGKRK